MTKRNRDYSKEYARRKQLGLAKGRSLSQARGHAKPTEAFVAPKRRKVPSQSQVEKSLTVLAKGGNLRESARAGGLSEERLRDYISRQGFAEKVRGRWKIRKEVRRELPIFSKGKALTIVVNDVDGDLTLLTKYLGAVSRAFETNDPAYLDPFKHKAVKDVHGISYPFETRLGVLYAKRHADPFENIYRYVF